MIASLAWRGRGFELSVPREKTGLFRGRGPVGVREIGPHDPGEVVLRSGRLAPVRSAPSKFAKREVPVGFSDENQIEHRSARGGLPIAPDSRGQCSGFSLADLSGPCKAPQWRNGYARRKYGSRTARFGARTDFTGSHCPYGRSGTKISGAARTDIYGTPHIGR